jgi:hypothetical protein
MRDQNKSAMIHLTKKKGEKLQTMVLTVSLESGKIEEVVNRRP